MIFPTMEFMTLMIPEWKKGDWLTWLPCSLLLEIDRSKSEKCQVLD